MELYALADLKDILGAVIGYAPLRRKAGLIIGKLRIVLNQGITDFLNNLALICARIMNRVQLTWRS